ncbi:MAG TPA: hypothetical protein ENI23_06735 [bacterium]|nr:hypothetical protein [bacterium]
MKFLDWMLKLGEYILAASQTLLIISEFLASAALHFPTLIEYLYEGVTKIFDLKDTLLAQGAPKEQVRDTIEVARDDLIAATLEEFHGSGPQISIMFIKQIIEGIVALGKAERYGVAHFQDRDVRARDLGYLVSPDLELAKRTYPLLFGKR